MKTCSKCKEIKPLTDYHKSCKSFDKRKSSCKACAKMDSSKRYLLKKEHILKVNKGWRDDNPHKYAEYRDKYRPARRAAHARRRAGEKLRSVSWSCKELVGRVYRYAKIMEDVTGEPWHVDHIVPLMGKTVSGLHVHNNLQAVPATFNLSKGNKFEVQNS